MADLRSLWSQLASLTVVALRSFLGTVLVLLVLGLVLAGMSYYLLGDHPGYGLLAAALALAESLALGVLLGGQRALLSALIQGIRSLGLGRTAVQLLFEHLLGISGEQEFGARGGTIARTVEHLPLAQAEERLNQVVRDLLRAPAAGSKATGWIRRRLEAKLVGSVQKYTLARFREEGAQQGGVDLRKVQQTLEGRVDDWVMAKLQAGRTGWTVLVSVGLPTLVLVQTYLVIALLK